MSLIYTHTHTYMHCIHPPTHPSILQEGLLSSFLPSPPGIKPTSTLQEHIRIIKSHVISIRRDLQLAILAEGKVLPYDFLILASGLQDTTAWRVGKEKVSTLLFLLVYFLVVYGCMYIYVCVCVCACTISWEGGGFNGSIYRGCRERRQRYIVLCVY